MTLILKLNPVLIPACLTLALAGARADVVTDWNATALAATDAATPQLENRILAMTHVAMFDAVNAITQIHAPFASQPSAAPGSSIDAAAATAGHAVLVALLPAQKPMLDNALAATLGRVADVTSKEDGIAVGRQAAERILALRTGDGADRKPDYAPVAARGRWQPTPPHDLPFASVIWADVKPWVLRTATEVPPPGPPALDSAQYQRDIDEVRRLGARHSKDRTGDQTAAAIFSSIKPGQLWAAAARAAVAARGNSIVENARLFALMNIAATDATIAGWSIKRQYAVWRPISAIRQAPTDGDANWEPLLNTPPHPDYVSGHCIVSGATAEVLRRLLKSDGVPFTATYGPPGTGLTRSFATITQAEKEVGDARVWAGIHTRTADEHGGIVGHKIGELVVQRAMQPLATANAVAK
jgi:hypothetical protein